MLLFIPAAQVQMAPLPPTPAIEALQAQLKGVAEVFLGGQRGAMKGRIAEVRKGWSQSQAELRKVFSDAEVQAGEQQLKALDAMKPAEQAAGALAMASSLARTRPAGRATEAAKADLLVMLAWCHLEAGQWGRMPQMDLALKPLLAQDKGDQPLVMISLKDAARRVQAAQPKKDGPAARKALKELRGLLAGLAKG